MSALKTWILFFCAAFWIAACSDDSSPHKVVIEELGDEDSAENGGDSGDSGKSGKSGKGSSGSSSKPTSAETIVINGGKDTIYVADAEGSLYYSSGVFCWTEGCEAKFTSSSSKANSSSSKTGSSSSKGKSSSSVKASSSSVKSSSSAAPPTVTDKDMTDNRDGNKYKIQKIGDVTWMTENLRFNPSSGTYCDATAEVTKEGPGEETQTVNVCEYYGVYYSSSLATQVCPPGWRLPTQAEVTAAIDAISEKPEAEMLKWWPMSGRFKTDQTPAEWGNEGGKQGYLWIDGGVLQVQNYNNFENKFLDVNTKRAYTLRCVTSN